MNASAENVYVLEIDSGELTSDLKRAEGAFDHLGERAAAATAKMTAGIEKQLRAASGMPASVDKVTAAYEKLRGGMDPVWKAQQAAERQMLRSLGTINSAVRAGVTTEEQAAKDIAQMRAQQVAQIQSVIDRQQMLAAAPGAAGLGKIGAAAKLTSNQMLNLSRQGNDVVTMFALGAPPMQIFASQAGQIYDALEQGPAGIKGSLKAIGEGLLGLITRFPVATAAIVAIGAAVVAYKLLADEKIKSVDEVLKQHEANIKRLGPAYEEASKGLHKYADESAALANLRFRTDAADALRTRADEATKAIENMVRSEGIFSSRFSGAKDAIDAFMASIKAGEPEAVKFQEAIAGLRESGQISEKVAQDLVSAANAAYEAEQKLRGVADRTDAVAKAFSDMSKALAADAIAPLSRLSDEQRKYIETLIDHLKRGQISADQFKSSLTSLSAVNPDFSGAISGVSGLADQLERAQRAAEGLANTTPRTRRLGAMDEAQKGFDDAFTMWRRFGRDKDSGIDPLKKQDKAAEDAAKSYDKLIDSAQRRLDQMQTELSLVGKAGAAVEAYRMEQDLLSRAKEREIDLTPKQIEQIHDLADAYGLASQKIDEARLASDLMFERDQIGRTGVDKRVADQMRDLYGDDYQSHMNGAIAGQIRFNDAMQKTGELSEDAFGTIIDALTSTGDLADNLISAFAQIGKAHAPMDLKTLMKALKGKSQ